MDVSVTGPGTLSLTFEPRREPGYTTVGGGRRLSVGGHGRRLSRTREWCAVGAPVALSASPTSTPGVALAHDEVASTPVCLDHGTNGTPISTGCIRDEDRDGGVGHGTRVGVGRCFSS